MSEFSQTIRFLRKRASLPQRKVAEILQVDRSMLSYYETGKSLPKLFIVKRLCELYGADFLSLLPAYMEAEEIQMMH